MPTYEPPSLSKIFRGTTTHFSRVHLDIEVRLSVDVLDLVDPWLQFSVLEYGREAAGRAHGRG